MKMILGGYNDFPHFTLRFVKKTCKTAKKYWEIQGISQKRKKCLILFFGDF